MGEDELGFGTRKTQPKKRESAIAQPQSFEVPQQQFEVPTQKPFEPTIEMDEEGDLLLPERPLSRAEQEQVTCITLFKKHKENFDERILWYIKVEVERELYHYASAFSPELKNLTKRLKIIEKRFGIMVADSERIGFDHEIEEEEKK